MNKNVYAFSIALFLVTITSTIFSQNVGISKTGTTPDASAMLDVSADSMGILIPRVSLNSIKDDTTITNPATSLLVYNTNISGNLSSGFYYWSDTIWVGVNNLWKRNGSDIYYSEGFVGVGTESPQYQFEVAREGQVANIVATTYRDGYSAGSITGRGARGTMNEPMALLEGNYIAAFNARGYTGTKFTHIPPSGRIAFAATEDWSDFAQGTSMRIYTTANGDTTSHERMRISGDGYVGIGVPDPENLLSVIGNSGEAFKPIAYFENTCDTVDGDLVDAFGIMGVCDQSDWAGYGVYGKGGFIGVRGRVIPTDTFSYYGGHFQASGGAGENFGAEGYASGGGRNIGVRGRANSGNSNIGIYGQADTTGVQGTYAGYFEGDGIITGRLGVGLDNPAYKVHVIGDSGEPHTPIAYFENTCDTVEGQLVDAYGVMGICDQTDWAGYGGYFKGGYIGALGLVNPTDTGTYFGTRGIANGGSGNNYGLHGFAGGDGINIGVRGRADGPNENFGVWGFASQGVSNYAVFGQADTLGVTGTYAGYFWGDTHISGSLGIGTETPSSNLEVAQDQGIATITSTTYRGSGFSAGQFIGRAARGTMDTPSAVQAGDALASFNGRGYGETGFSSLPRARLGIRAAENWTDASQGAYLTLETTPVGTIENTTERMRITSEGYVGIGTTAPAEMLEVDGNAKADTVFADAYSSNSPLLLQTNKTTRIYVDDVTGDVGIGTSNPHGQFEVFRNTIANTTVGDFVVDPDNKKVYVGRLSTTPYNSSDFIVRNRLGHETFVVSAANYISLGNYNGAAEQMRVVFDGVTFGVGIGTTTPGYKLDVSGDINFSGSLRNNGIPLNFTADFSNGGEAGGADRVLGNTDNYALSFKTNNVASLHIADNGNIGIGTSNPFGDLQIEDSDGDPTFSILRSIPGSEAVSLFSQEGSGLVLYVNSGTTHSAPAKMMVTTSGKVGIGTTNPQASLQVNGGVQIANDTDTASADKVGTLRYRVDLPNTISYAEMCMQTGASTYEWIIIQQNNW